jgi:hypothetical protein
MSPTEAYRVLQSALIPYLKTSRVTEKQATQGAKMAERK